MWSNEEWQRQQRMNVSLQGRGEKVEWGVQAEQAWNGCISGLLNEETMRMGESEIFVGRRKELEKFTRDLEDPRGQAMLVVGQAGRA